jgi:D-alanyl-D-alanine carboxypeptidase
MPGTSSGLKYSDIITVYELLHALMLPSGNDAAVMLAEWGGKMIRKYCGLANKYLEKCMR